MQTLSEIRDLLASRGLRPRKRFGQNFLHDHNLIRKLVAAADIRPGERILEIGPGTGALTEALLEAGAQVVACEIDRDLAAMLRERLGMDEPRVSASGLVCDDDSSSPAAGRSTAPSRSRLVSERGRFTLIEGDCLESSRRLSAAVVDALAGRRSGGGEFKLVANLPYNVASPLITTLLIDHPECRGQFVTIQREVAERLLAGPGTKEYGPLTIIVQSMAEVSRLAVLPPSCFWPQPKVESAMVAILPAPSSGGGRGAGGEGALIEGAAPTRPATIQTPSPLTPLPEGEGDWSSAARRDFARFVTTLFTKRRKQLGTIFGREREWPPGVDPKQRPEALSVGQLIELWRMDTPQ